MFNFLSLFSDKIFNKYLVNDPSTPELVEQIKIPNIGFLKYSVNNLNFDPKNNIEKQSLNCYVTIGNCINYIQSKNKQPIKKWSVTSNLNIIPQAGSDLNAYYDRFSLKFFYYKTRGKIIFTSDSSDIVAHELGHAILDAIRPDFWNVQSLEIWSFHEAFSDIVALVSIMQYDSIIKKSLEETNNDLSKSSSITKLAEEFGSLVYNITEKDRGFLSNCLRDPAVEKFKYVNPNNLPEETSNNKLAAECHSFGRVFSAVWYDIFVKIYKIELEKTKDPVLSVKKSRDLCFSVVLRAAYESPLVVNYFSALAKTILNIIKIKNIEYLQVFEESFADWNLIKPVKILSTKNWKDIVYNLKKEDEVINNKDFKVVKIKNKKFIKINKISMLSSENKLNDVEIEVPGDEYYKFDKKGNLIDEIVDQELEVMDSAKICLKFVQSSLNSMWDIKDGKLIRNYIS